MLVCGLSLVQWTAGTFTMTRVTQTAASGRSISSNAVDVADATDTVYGSVLEAASEAAAVFGCGTCGVSGVGVQQLSNSSITTNTTVASYNVWVGLTKLSLQNQNDMFQFYLDWESVSRTNPSLDFFQFVIAGRGAIALSLIGMFFLFTSFCCGVLSPQKRSASKQRLFRILCVTFAVIAAIWMELAVIVYATQAPKSLGSGIRGSTISNESYYYSSCFYLVLFAGVCCFIAAVLVFFWRPPLEKAALKTGNMSDPASEPLDDGDKILDRRVRNKKLFALASLLLCAVAGSFIVAGAAVTEWQIQSYILSSSPFGPTPGGQAVNVMVGLQFLRVEISCFTFQTTWQNINDFYAQNGEANLNPDQANTYQQYGAAGTTAIVIFSASIIAAVCYFIAGTYYILFLKPMALLRSLTLFLGFASFASATAAIIFWAIIRPQNQLLYFVLNASSRATSNQISTLDQQSIYGSSLYLAVFGAVLMFFVPVCQLFFKPDASRIVEVVDEQDQKNV